MCALEPWLTCVLQAATFKSIKSLVPLFDRVLVQRFKAETVRDLPYIHVSLSNVPACFLSFLLVRKTRHTYRKPRLASSCPRQQPTRRSRRRPSSLSAPARRTRTASSSSPPFRRVTVCCSLVGAAMLSRSAKTYVHVWLMLVERT
jgi:hypothetical protein